MKKQTALEAYEEKKAEIETLLQQIKAGLLAHDRGCRTGRHWGHVGDLNWIAQDLTDIRDRLHRTGEYAELNRKGRQIKGSIPLTD